LLADFILRLARQLPEGEHALAELGVRHPNHDSIVDCGCVVRAFSISTGEIKEFFRD
jgi:hypothetical protein